MGVEKFCRRVNANLNLREIIRTGQVKGWLCTCALRLWLFRVSTTTVVCLDRSRRESEISTRVRVREQMTQNSNERRVASSRKPIDRHTTTTTHAYGWKRPVLQEDRPTQRVRKVWMV